MSSSHLIQAIINKAIILFSKFCIASYQKLLLPQHTLTRATHATINWDCSTTVGCYSYLYMATGRVQFMHES